MRDKEFQVYADCIRSDQIPASEVYELFKEEPEFAAWYRKKYVPNEAEAKIERWMNKNPDNSWVQETGLRILRKLLRKKILLLVKHLVKSTLQSHLLD